MTVRTTPITLFPMEKFAGDGTTGAKEWLFTYEATASAMGWSGTLKLALVTNYLEGYPRTWATERPERDNWEAWKTEFRAQFQQRMTTAVVMRKLLATRYVAMKPGEYLPTVRHLLGQGGIGEWPDQLELLLPTLPKTIQREMRKHRPEGWQAFADILEVAAEEYAERMSRRPAATFDQDGPRKRRMNSSVTPYGDRRRSGCFECGATDHLKRECPRVKRERPSRVEEVQECTSTDSLYEVELQQ